MLVGFRPYRCQKMFVGGLGRPLRKAKAAKNLQHFFTFVALKIVLAQLQGLAEL
ncbi:hypothetical protein HPP92_027275 [Vanilla planifolia]|uniref:Uncharacterized protein n=1 Tax=Vanilla planifolia TaxID=51239 RepID=A0A835PC38_VANPL|nr:hypothetical protein HPP92_027275 [Vanilla planifolia]